MFQQAVEQNVQMTNILFIIANMEIKNKHIIDEKDKFVQHMQGALKKEYKFTTKLQDKNNENNQVLVELQVVKQNINNMEKQNKDMENVVTKRNSLQVTLKETYVNYWNLNAKKDILNVEHNKLQRVYKNMEQTLLKQQKELEDLNMENRNVYQATMKYKGKLIRSMHKWKFFCRSRWPLMRN